MRLTASVLIPLLVITFGFTACHLDVLDARKDGLIAGFDYTVLSGRDGVVPVSYQFTNTSAEAISYEWDFGDGTPVATNFNPTHRYTKAGDYSVTLRARNANGEEDVFTAPLTVRAGTFALRGLPLDGTVGLNNIEQSNDSTYTVRGYLNRGSESWSLILDLDVAGDTLNARAFPQGNGTMSPTSSLASLPILNQDGALNTEVYYEDGAVTLFYWVSFDVAAIVSYPELGNAARVILTDDGHAVILGSPENENGITWLSVLQRNQPGEVVRLTSLYNLEDAVSRNGSGVAVLASRLLNAAEEQLRLYFYDAHGDRIATSIIFPAVPLADWRLASTGEGGYRVFGVTADSLVDLRLDDRGEIQEERVMESTFTRIEQVIFNEDGSFAILGEEPSPGQRPPGIGVRKYSPAGEEVWDYHYNAEFILETTYAEQLLATQDCGYLVRAYGDPLTQAPLPVIIKLNANGQVE